MLDIVHKQFITRVKEGRGNRLHVDDETFRGYFGLASKRWLMV